MLRSLGCKLSNKDMQQFLNFGRLEFYNPTAVHSLFFIIVSFASFFFFSHGFVLDNAVILISYY
jgi:hypothetical protein